MVWYDILKKELCIFKDNIYFIFLLLKKYQRSIAVKVLLLMLMIWESEYGLLRKSIYNLQERTVLFPERKIDKMWTLFIQKKNIKKLFKRAKRLNRCWIPTQTNFLNKLSCNLECSFKSCASQMSPALYLSFKNNTPQNCLPFIMNCRAKKRIDFLGNITCYFVEASSWAFVSFGLIKKLHYTSSSRLMLLFWIVEWFSPWFFLKYNFIVINLNFNHICSELNPIDSMLNKLTEIWKTTNTIYSTQKNFANYFWDHFDSSTTIDGKNGFGFYPFCV